MITFLQQPVTGSQEDIFKRTFEWKQLAPLPVGHCGHTAVLLGGHVYVGGGYEGTHNRNRHESYRLDVYNSTARRWRSPPITTP